MPSPTTRSRRVAGHLFAAILVLIVGAGSLLVTWPSLVGAQYLPGVAQAVSLRGATVTASLVLALVLLVGAVVARPFRRLGSTLALVLIVAAGIGAAVIGVRGIGGGGDASGAQQGGAITVLSWNTLGDSPGPRAISDLAIETGADIVALPETTEATAVEIAAAMADVGIDMEVHHASFDDDYVAKQTALLISSDLGAYSIDLSLGTTSIVPSVVATPDDGEGPTIVAAHPVAPIPGYLDDWRADLDWLRSVCADESGEGVLLAGDLNSTLDHYGPLADRDGATVGECTDAAEAAGAAAVGTWPTSLPALLGAPIDHIMATGQWSTSSFRVVDDRDGAGSDHRPVVATLVPAG